MNAGRKRVVFLMSKDPLLERGGDVEMTELAVGLASVEFDVSVICMSSQGGSPGLVADHARPMLRVAKPEVRPVSLLGRSMRRRRSLVHVRFDTPELREAIEQCDADVFVAEHSYMAEAFLNSSAAATKRLVVSTHVSEALVWEATRGYLGRLESPRLRRDELRVARAASAVGTFDAAEAEHYRALGVETARWLDLTLPPGPRTNLGITRPRLVLLGTRSWPPNQEAFVRAVTLWPRIARGISGAELVVVGGKGSDRVRPALPDGVRDLGFVPDLAGLLATCRAMMAPVRTGGGVRVKLLEAASIGMPFIGSSEAVGSLAAVLGLSTFDDDDLFINECRRLLVNPSVAADAGADLYEKNQAHWRRERPRLAVKRLIES